MPLKLKLIFDFNRMSDTRKELALRGKIAELELEVETKDTIIKHLESRVVGGLQIPDPEIFDNATISYALWVTKMEHKLAADTGASETTRMAYVVSRLARGTGSHLLLRMDPRAVNKFTNTDEMFEVLDRVFRKPKDLAHQQFTSLKQGESVGTFMDFLQNFQILISVSGRHYTERELVLLLYSKLNTRLKAGLPSGEPSPQETFDMLVTKCVSIDVKWF